MSAARETRYPDRCKACDEPKVLHRGGFYCREGVGIYEPTPVIGGREEIEEEECVAGIAFKYDECECAEHVERRLSRALLALKAENARLAAEVEEFRSVVSAMAETSIGLRADLESERQKTATVAEHLGRVNRDCARLTTENEGLRQSISTLKGVVQDLTDDGCQCDESVGLTCPMCRAARVFAALSEKGEK